MDNNKTLQCLQQLDNHTLGAAKKLPGTLQQMAANLGPHLLGCETEPLGYETQLPGCETVATVQSGRALHAWHVPAPDTVKVPALEPLQCQQPQIHTTCGKRTLQKPRGHH